MGKREMIIQAAIERVGCGYIYGGTGANCKVSYREARIAQYPEYKAKIIKNCMIMSGYANKCSDISSKTKKPCPWYDALIKIGVKLYDCAQLTRACAKLAGITLPSGSNSQWNADVWEAKGTIDTLPADARAINLFWQNNGKMTHTAWSIGDGELVEARGHDYGVQRSKIASRKPTHWAKLRGLDGDTVPTVPVTPEEPSPTVIRETLRKGDKGLAVAEMQKRLLAHGVLLPKYGADGDFGQETLIAVRQFQGLNGLTVDGICGPKTWAALDKEPNMDEPDDDPVFTVTITGLPAAEKDALLAKYPNATAEEM